MTQPSTDHARSGEVRWTREGVVITEAALELVDRDARDRYARDEEACGYLTGPSGPGTGHDTEALLCDRVFPLENMANKLHELDPETYFRTAKAFFAFNEKRFDDAVRRGAADGQPVKVLYHSHLDAGAYFSATDAAVLSLGEPPAVEGGPSKLGPGPAWPLAFLVCSVTRDGVTRDGVTRDGVTRDGETRDGETRDAVIEEGLTKDGRGDPVVVDRRLYVWAGDAFVEAPMRVIGSKEKS